MSNDKSKKWYWGTIIIPLIIGIGSGLGSFYIARIQIEAGIQKEILKTFDPQSDVYVQYLKTTYPEEYIKIFEMKTSVVLDSLEKYVWIKSFKFRDKMQKLYKNNEDAWINIVVDEKRMESSLNYCFNTLTMLANMVKNRELKLSEEKRKIIQGLIDHPFVTKNNKNTRMLENIEIILSY